jgi:probable HAF family extracellular repeat protein
MVAPCHLEANPVIGFIYSDGMTTLFPQAVAIYQINDSGDFVGELRGGDAFVYRAGVSTDLGHAGAYGINNHGLVVGTVDGHAFSYLDGVFTDLGIPFGTDVGIAYAVNDSGAIAGFSESTPRAQRSWLIDGNSTTNLGTLPGGINLTNVFGMNNSGQIVGDAQVSLSISHMFIWSSATGMVDLGLGIGNANAINDQGYAVGFFEAAEAHAFLYHNGITIDLQQSVFGPAGWIGSNATGINDAG